MLFLLTNDDGYRAAGLLALRRALARHGRVVTVAPASEMSGVSHALTLSRPLTRERIDEDFYIVDGTPSDCVHVALNGLLDQRPSACLSGINHGPNLGDDVTYSGTVGAAIEGTLFGVPSVAVSQLRGPAGLDFTRAAEIAALWGAMVGRRELALPPGAFLNLNVPDGPPRGVSATRLARRAYLDGIREHEDPRGRTVYWVGGRAVWQSDPGTDHHAVTTLRHVSVSLLGTDLSRALPEPSGDAASPDLGPCLARVAAALVDVEEDVPEAGEGA